MATIIPQPLGKCKTSLHTVKIDMTPMVDLGFLLITFFIFTTSLTQPTVSKLTMPAKSVGTMSVNVKTLLTAVLDKDGVFVYEGVFEKVAAQSKFVHTDYNVRTGLGNSVRQKQMRLAKEKMKDDLMVIIKPLPTASYQDVINALDEMLLNGVSRYSVVDASANEKKYFEKHH